MPHSLEFPRMLRSVVKLMGGQRLAGLLRRVVHEAVALPRRPALRRLLQAAPRRVPRLAAIIGALDDLPEPSARLRNVDTVLVHRRPLHVVNLPASEEWPTDFPVLALAVRSQNERALLCPHQHAHLTHPGSPPFVDNLPATGRPRPAIRCFLKRQRKP